MNHNKINLKRIGLYGISGVGKTTLLKEITGRTDQIVWFEGAKLVLEAAGLSLDSFKKLSEKEKYVFREKAIDIAFARQLQVQKSIIIDGHLAFATGECQYENIMTENDKSFYTQFIYLELDPEIVMQRQQNDLTKKRVYSRDTIANWIAFEKQELEMVCKENNIPLCVVKNESYEHCIEVILNAIHNN